MEKTAASDWLKRNAVFSCLGVFFFFNVHIIPPIVLCLTHSLILPLPPFGLGQRARPAQPVPRALYIDKAAQQTGQSGGGWGRSES